MMKKVLEILNWPLQSVKIANFTFYVFYYKSTKLNISEPTELCTLSGYGVCVISKSCLKKSDHKAGSLHMLLLPWASQGNCVPLSVSFSPPWQQSLRYLVAMRIKWPKICRLVWTTQLLVKWNKHQSKPKCSWYNFKFSKIMNEWILNEWILKNC